MTQQTLRDYCKQNKIRVSDLSKATGISASYLYDIQDDAYAPVTTFIMHKMYDGTLKEYGKGLRASDWLSIP